MSPSTKKILVVDDDGDFRWAMGNVLQGAGFHVSEAEDGEKGLKVLHDCSPDLVLLDYRMPGKDGLETALEIRERAPSLPIIMITAYAEVHSAVKAMKMGVYDYVTKPIDNQDLLFSVKRALETQDLTKEVKELRTALNKRTSLYETMGSSDKIKNMIGLVEKVAPTPFTVLIQGASGTGKELVSRAVHDLSAVREGPFVALDCGAIPETLIESELFGYMKGAFTGAHADKPGRFESAEGGTVFLDEVSNLPFEAQQKLLRVVEERRVQRLGARKSRPVRVRIIAAGNKPLEEEVAAGTFRPDLFYRLSEFTISVPGLKERQEDIPYLAKRFADEAAKELKKKGGGFTRQALSMLTAYDWPGNVRELRNVIRQAALLCGENLPIDAEHLLLSGHSGATMGGASFTVSSASSMGSHVLKDAVKAHTGVVEKRLIGDTLAATKGNKSEAARRLGIDYKTLLRKIKIHGVGS